MFKINIIAVCSKTNNYASSKSNKAEQLNQPEKMSMYDCRFGGRLFLDFNSVIMNITVFFSRLSRSLEFLNSRCNSSILSWASANFFLA